jgi:maleate isomerase
MSRNLTSAGEVFLAARKRIGHITPSSNTVLEPVTAALNHSISDRVTHHFSRIRVTQIALDASSSQFDLEPMLAAADLLADSQPDILVWNGTSSSWLGLKQDEILTQEIHARTGVMATTSTLAFFDAFQMYGFERIGVAVPYDGAVTAQLEKEYARHGVEVVSRAFLGQNVNHEFGRNTPDTLRALLRAADSPQAQCLAVVCTNLAVAPLLEEMEAELNKPILDSIALTFWQACRLAKVDLPLAGWGRLLAQGLPLATC